MLRTFFPKGLSRHLAESSATSKHIAPLLLGMVCLLCCDIYSLEASIVTPGVTRNWEAGVSPDGDNDNKWESTVGTFDLTFLNGSQTPVALSTIGALSSPGEYAFDKAYAFNAGKGNASSLTSLGGGGPATFEVWFRPNDLNGKHAIFETGGNVNGTSIGLIDNQLRFISQASTSLRMTVNTTLSSNAPNKFTQVLGSISVDGSNNAVLSVYVNGQFVGSDSTSSFNLWAGGSGTGLGIDNGFAGEGTAGSNSYDVNAVPDFAGHIAVIRFYNKALTAAEAEANYVSQIPEPSTCVVFGGLILCFGLAGWWRKRRAAVA